MSEIQRTLMLFVALNCFFVSGKSFDIKDLFQKAGLKRVKRTASCSIDNGGCDIDCEDTPVGAQCSCPEGFNPRLDGRSCEDINECETNNGGCESNCHNSHSSYRCSCEAGFKLNTDEKTCSDFNECGMNDTCAHVCRNTIGSYVCSCHEGYKQYATGRCGDIDECAENNGGCDHFCKNTEGSHECSCREGYSLHWNGKDCIRADRCSTIPSLRHGRLIAKQRKMFRFECYRLHNFTLTESSFFYSCGDDSQLSISRAASSYPWTTRYSHRNTSSSCDEHLIIKKEFTIPLKRCSASISGLQNYVIRGGNVEELDLLRFRVSCIKISTRGRGRSSRRKKPYTLQVQISVLAEPGCCRRTAKGKCKRSRSKCINKVLSGIKRMRKGKSQLLLGFPTFEVEVGKKNGPTMLKRKTYTMCSKGSVFDPERGLCVNCSQGYYQDRVGQMQCIECPVHTGEPENEIIFDNAYQSLFSCPGVCMPGYYSSTGMEPCQPCPINTYQPYHGRIGCFRCGTGYTNMRLASTSFSTCSARGTCSAGHYYDVRLSSCKRCPKHYYQDKRGMNFCHRCPGDTKTDMDASTAIEACKSHDCGQITSNIQGYIQSPNYPGDYPINTVCRWEITPPDRRKLLLVIPEMHLRGEDGCGDRLAILRVKGTKIITTTESCQSFSVPKIENMRAKKLIIEFRSDGWNNSKGFKIPYVTYDEDYEAVISDIVSDSRLFSINYHQDILKSTESRRTLLNVLADPKNYFVMLKQHSFGLFRKSFIEFLQNKVITFLHSPS